MFCTKTVDKTSPLIYKNLCNNWARLIATINYIVKCKFEAFRVTFNRAKNIGNLLNSI